MKIRMTSIPVLDPIKAYKVYTEILGFQELMYDPKERLAIIVSAEASTETAIILEPSDNEISHNYRTALYAAKIPVMTFSTENLKEEYIRLTNLDIRFIKTPTEVSWGWEAIFDDGCGNYLQLIQEAES